MRRCATKSRTSSITQASSCQSSLSLCRASSRALLSPLTGPGELAGVLSLAIPKRPFYFYRAGGEALVFAGLFDLWFDAEANRPADAVADHGKCRFAITENVGPA